MSPSPATSRDRAGLSLLEVLVACGILAMGLASVAAILPAAATRLGQATQEDRAGILAANARAEAAARGLIAADVFSTPTKACVFGQVATSLTSGTLLTGTTWTLSSATASTVLPLRADTAYRGFVLEDDLVYTPSTTTETPRNSFVANGPREFRDPVCWGATLAPLTGTATIGAPAILGIAVFRKAGIAQQLVLTSTAGLLRYSTGTANWQADEASRKRFLGGCTYVLALPLNPATAPPAWLKVNSSWTNPGPIVSGTEDVSKRASFCVLSWNGLTVSSTNYLTSVTSGSVTVLGFENLMRVEQYPVTLD